MTKFIVLVNFYQELQAGSRLLENLDSLKLPSIWYDGRVDGFKQLNNSDVSTDGLPELIMRYKRTALMRGFKETLGYGRTKLMRLAAAFGYDFALIVDCDEYITGDVALFEKNLEKLALSEPRLLSVRFVEHHKNKELASNNADYVERLIYKPRYMTVKTVHYQFFHNYHGFDTKVDSDTMLIEGITIHQDDTVREKSRNDHMTEYQKERRKIEIKSLRDE